MESTTPHEQQKPERPTMTGAPSRYGAMRTWATFLYAIGFISAAFAAIGAIVSAIEVHNFWQALGILLIAGPITVFLATFPIALSQSMNALADVAETVTGPDVPNPIGGRL
jgi:asparagine N-glycosylation enzyme membrane subunit Stt3